MMANVKELFVDLLALTEVRKVDYKRDQYLLDDENLKSKFIKDIVCIANAPGDEGYILLGVESEKGKPRKVVGISHHYDSSDLEAIVNSVIEPPIQFEYYPLNYKGAECALFHIPMTCPPKRRPVIMLV
jgi:predicted HTH transcriptional regulator